MYGTQLLLPGFEWSPVNPNSKKRVAVWCFCFCPAPRVASSPVPAPDCPLPALPPSRAFAGSRLFLSSPAFLSRVASGACPVGLSLSVFSWPVRSAVLLSLLRVLSSPRVFGAVGFLPGIRPVLSRFLAVGLRALGVSSLSGLSRFAPPVVPSFPVVSVRVSSLFAAFSSLSRCLAWLLRRGCLCPSSLRPALASLLSVVASLLA